ncbi:MAG: phospholipase D-like domain-containing protein [marine benthic group bacterium]|nr:phospholipase D-like domain-containing protein [Candidatus Benthicola marisminoris]
MTLLQTAWPYIAATLAFLLSLLVSAHILLHKREVRAAVGWIGLAWLAPVVGSLLYLVFGINRIKRRGSEIHASMDRVPVPRRLPATLTPPLPAPPLDESLRELARSVDRVTRNELLAGNRIEPLRNGDAAYPEMLRAIREARTSVALATYIFDMDRAGREFADALAEAVSRGVHVRVLIDGVGAAYSRPRAPGVLRELGIQVGQFGGGMVPWRMPYVNLRNHRKILVVDGSVGFTGGMNIRESSYLALGTRYPTRDLHFKLEGPVVAQLVDAFAQDWTHTTGEQLPGALWCPPLKPVGPSAARGISDGPDDDFEKLSWTILAGLRSAHRHVRIVTPYFLPDQALLTALNVVAMAGVRLDIVLPERSNLRIVGWAMRAQLAQVMEYGARVWLSPSPFDHSKLMLVDDGWALFGSGNWDPRSLRLNFEFNVECYDEQLVTKLDELVTEKINDARPLSRDELDRRSLPVKLRDGAAWLFSPYL